MDQPKRKIEIEDRRLHDEPADAATTGAEAAAGGEAETNASASAAAAAEPQGSDPMELAQQHLELAQRKEAELRNYMQRVKRDIEDARRFAVEGLLADLFPVLDGLAQVAQSYKDRPAGEDAVLDGLRSTLKGLRGALGKHGIAPIDAAGVPYDAHVHQALSVDESAEATEETVAEVYVEGWRMGDIVLKPALVRVVKPQD